MITQRTQGRKKKQLRMATTITFQSEEIKFTLKEKTRHKLWLAKIASKEKYSVLELNYIFCSDEYLHQVNLDYLNHDTYTDIITFDNSEDKKSKVIEGDIFISIERVKENAVKYTSKLDDELHRVMAHGLLHLMGYKDKTTKDSVLMREKEEESIALFKRIK
ncbi:MAG TPA: rRNA maturation RNase YbeY [Cytophagaceae bacterium]|jgi:probable rRNA maturation factor|nr:rRNA maturation RNase YbeY [Cytophagaceae bacterium]